MRQDVLQPVNVKVPEAEANHPSKAQSLISFNIQKLQRLVEGGE